MAKIIVVDDESGSRESVSRSLRAAGHQVFEAADGAQALQVIRSEYPQLSKEITERKNAEERCRKSEAQLAEAQHLARLGSWDWDIVNNTLTWSDELYRILGAEPGGIEISYDTVAGRVHPDDKLDFDRVIKEAVERGEPYSHEFKFIGFDGAVRVFHSKGAVIKNEAGEAVRMFGTSQDVTERAQMERDLRESEERFRQIAENIREVFWMVDVPFTANIYISPAYEEIWGRTRESLYRDPSSFLKAVHLDDLERVRAFVEKGTFEPCSMEYRIIRPDGKVRWIHDRAVPIRDKTGNIYRVTGLAEDITDRKQSEVALRESQAQLRALADRLIAAREEEATRIAREIHDDLGQCLTSLKLDATWMQEQLGASRKAPSDLDLYERLDAMMRSIDVTIERTRKICVELRPGVLDELGLVAALEWQAQEFEARTGMFCNLSLPSSDPPLNNQRATTVFRIFQEVLTNIARHSEATEVYVRMEITEHAMSLRVTDNGRGIPEAEIANATGLGLVGMRERALAAGGSLSIRGKTGEGTTVILRLPLSKTKS